MKHQKIWANLGVTDLDRTTKFYSAIGFRPNGSSDELTSFIYGDDSFIIHFFLKDVLTKAMKGEIIDAHQANEIIFTLSAESKDRVDEWAREIKQAGGDLISEPEAFGQGYYGFVFADPDGHKFNVFFM